MGCLLIPVMVPINRLGGYDVPQTFAVLTCRLNPLTLRVPLGSIVCYFHTFENNLGIKQKFTKYLREGFCFTSGQHFSFKYFPKKGFVRNIFSKLLGLFWPL